MNKCGHSAYADPKDGWNSGNSDIMEVINLINCQLYSGVFALLRLMWLSSLKMKVFVPGCRRCDANFHIFS